MLDYEILNYKSKLSLNENDFNDSSLYIDLLSKTIDLSSIRLENFTFVTVANEYTARPDLISLAVYGDDKYADIICKVNGISNPFEVNAGMILIIPAIETVLTYLTKGLPNKIAKPDELITSSVKTNQKSKNEKRTPAQQVVGENTFIIDRTNKIVYY
jgi:hypothetical protein